MPALRPQREEMVSKVRSLRSATSLVWLISEDYSRTS
jgi:hypothetical protein